MVERNANRFTEGKEWQEGDRQAQEPKKHNPAFASVSSLLHADEVVLEVPRFLLGQGRHPVGTLREP